MPAWGFYARNVERITLEDVRVSCAQEDYRPVVAAENVQRLDLDNFRFTHVPDVTEPLLLTNVAQFDLHNTEMSSRPAR